MVGRSNEYDSLGSSANLGSRLAGRSRIVRLFLLLQVAGSRAAIAVDLVMLPYPSDWTGHLLRALDRLLRCGVRPLAASGGAKAGWEQVGHFARPFLTGSAAGAAEDDWTRRDSNC